MYNNLRCEYNIPMNDDYIERLQQKLKMGSKVQEQTDCWEWQGQISNSGRGRITIKDFQTGANKVVSAETASFIAFKSNENDQVLAKQTCGNRLCINPDHLEKVELSHLIT